MMSLDDSTGRTWSPDELGAVLRHQLSVRLEFDLGDLRGDEHSAADRSREAARLSWAVNFGELLRHPNPPLDMLSRVKHFAKACRNQPNGPLPREVATVLYFASIIAARMRAGRRISELNDHDIRSGVEWSLSQPWNASSLRPLFEEALGFFDPARAEPE
jgi:hypothetical protein